MYKVIYVCDLFIFSMAFGSFVAMSAQLRMLEAAVSRRYHMAREPPLIDVEEEEVPGIYCKLDPIQSGVALIYDWLAVIDGIVSRRLSTVPPF